MKHTGFKVVVIILLALLLIVEGGRLYVQWQQWNMASAINDTGQAQLALMREEEARREAQSEIVENFNTATDQVIAGLLDTYKKAAYDNPEVDTIYHQQLIAAEYNMQALHLLMRQNQLLLQLLAGK